MRHTLRLLADVKPGRYLEAGNPTGLTGLFTHPAPRTTLLYTYGATLDKLQSFPDHSVYRQSTEALTKHRMNIIQSIKPEGYDEWAVKAKEKREKYPEAFGPGGDFAVISAGGQEFVTPVERPGIEESVIEDRSPPEKEVLVDEIVDYEKEDYDFYTPEVEEVYDEKERESEPPARIEHVSEQDFDPRSRPDYIELVDWQPEPPLEASQISEAETRIGGGLIEEVIEVAEGELELVETMAESRVWEELEEQPPEGQWSYFARDQHTPGTQAPPK